jgi:hypothetical protein
VRGEAADGAVNGYAPLEEGPPIALARDAESVPIGWSTRLAVRHAAGDVRITARFFCDPAGAPIAELAATLTVTEAGAPGR